MFAPFEIFTLLHAYEDRHATSPTEPAIL